MHSKIYERSDALPQNIPDSSGSGDGEWGGLLLIVASGFELFFSRADQVKNHLADP